jgi:hypothetical protein
MQLQALFARFKIQRRKVIQNKILVDSFELLQPRARFPIHAQFWESLGQLVNVQGLQMLHRLHVKLLQNGRVHLQPDTNKNFCEI